MHTRSLPVLPHIIPQLVLVNHFMRLKHRQLRMLQFRIQNRVSVSKRSGEGTRVHARCCSSNTADEDAVPRKGCVVVKCVVARLFAHAQRFSVVSVKEL